MDDPIRITVTRLPDKPCQCPFSSKRTDTYNGEAIWLCKLGSGTRKNVACDLGEGGFCPYLQKERTKK